MREHGYRPLLAAMALALALAGALGVAFLGGSSRPVSASDLFIIEVSTQGFNPRTCRINRDDRIQFRNVANVPIRVFKPGHGGFPPDPDELLQPGAVSSPRIYTAGITEEFFTEAGHSVKVMTPLLAQTWQVSCSKEAPTPTPTATPTATPTPTPTPPRPARCSWNGCAVSPNLAHDGE
jgi:hypothetical protein